MRCTLFKLIEIIDNFMVPKMYLIIDWIILFVQYPSAQTIKLLQQLVKIIQLISLGLILEKGYYLLVYVLIGLFFFTF